MNDNDGTNVPTVGLFVSSTIVATTDMRNADNICSECGGRIERQQAGFPPLVHALSPRCSSRMW